MEQISTPAKIPYTTRLLGAASSTVQLYAAGMTFSTGKGADRMRVEGMTMRTRTVFVAFLLFAVAAALTAAQAPKAAAPRDPAIIDVQGYQKLLDQYRGKPLLVTFWATWCEPCRDEYPMLNELAKQYAPQGLKVVGVSMDDDGDLILMRRFLARYKPVFINYRKKAGGEAAFDQAVMPGWSGALPATFLYARDGQQVGHVLGEGTRDTYETAIRSLLAAGSN
jgi:thiol-disulfide isomerase/thioredoxin